MISKIHLSQYKFLPHAVLFLKDEHIITTTANNKKRGRGKEGNNIKFEQQQKKAKKNKAQSFCFIMKELNYMYILFSFYLYGCFLYCIRNPSIYLYPYISLFLSFSLSSFFNNLLPHLHIHLHTHLHTRHHIHLVVL